MTLTIGKLARQADVTIETVRYYQRIGLLQEPVKPLNGFREYPTDAVARIRFIKRAQQTGFTLVEISELLSLDSGQCDDARKMAEQKCRQIDKQIQDLTALRSVLGGLVRGCKNGQSSRGCCLIETFSGQSSTKMEED